MALGISYVIEAVDDFTKTFNEFERKVKNMDEAANGFKAAGATMTAAGIGLAAGIGAAVKTGMEFDAQMAKVQAIAGATSEEFAAMRQQALDLGASTSQSASTVAAGMKEMAAMGFEANEVMGAMPGVIAAAEASGAEMAQVAEVMASTLNIFGKEASEASKVADVLAQTANVSAADITDMQYALKYAGPPAASLGVTLEELSASIGIMTNAGMKGEQAGTSLRGALLGLLSPSEENSKMMTAMGVAIEDTEGNFVGIAQLVENLSASMDGMTDTQKAATLAQLVGKEAVSGMLSLMAAGPETIRNMTTELENSAGASAAAAAIMKDNFAGSVEELTGAIETMAIGISDALTPAIRAVTDQVTAAINWFNGMSESTRSFIAIAAALTAGLLLLTGPLVMLIGFIPSIIGGFTAIAGVFGVTAGVLGSFVLIAGGVVVAVGALIAAFILAYNKIDWFRKFVDQTWAAIKLAFTSALTAVREAVTQAMTAIRTFIGTELAGIRAFWDENGAQIIAIVKIFMAVIKGAIDVQMNAIKTLIGIAWTAIKLVFETTWAAIKLIVSMALNYITGVISAFLKLLKGDWKGALDDIKGIFTNTFNDIVIFVKSIGTSFYNAGKGLIDQMKNGIEAAATKVIDSVKNIAGSIRDLLPFSPAKDGPLSDIDRLDFAGPITDSIARGLPVVKAAMTHMLGNPNASIAGNTAIAGNVSGGGSAPTIVINATYVDRDAADRFAAEVNRKLGRQIGGKR